MNRNKKNLHRLLPLFLVVALLLCVTAIPNITYAAGPFERIGNWIEITFLTWLYYFFTFIPGILVWISGLLLNVSVEELVIEMGTLLTVGESSSPLGGAIHSLWAVIRDLMNMLFIFGLIYLGIKTILNSNDSNTKRSLVLLIGAALFINFSLFITKVIIDISNGLATQIFNLMNIATVGDISDSGFYGISGAFMDNLGVLSLSGGSDQIEAMAEKTGFGSTISFIFMVMIFLLIAAVVFAAGAFMIIARFVALVLYMIFSPVMFLGWVLPSFKNISSDWWKGVFQKSFFAPAYLFMLYISLITLSQFLSIVDGDEKKLDAAITGGDPSINGFTVILTFSFGIAMLIASIIVAQKMSIAGADTSMNVLKGMRNNAQSYMGRNLISRPADRAVKWLDKQDPNTRTSKFLRGAGRISGAALNVGTAGALGSGGVRSNLDKARNTKFGGAQSNKEMRKADDTLKKEQAVAHKAAKLSSTIKTVTKAIKNDGKASLDDQQAMEREIADASQKQIEELGAKTLKQQSVAGALTQSQFEAVLKSDEFSDDEKTEIGKARGAAVTYKLSEKDDEGNVTGRVKVEDGSIGELTSLGEATLVKPENAIWLSEKQMDDLEKKLTETAFGRIKKARKDGLIEVAQTGSYEGMTLPDLIKRKPGELAKLPKEVLTEPEVSTRLSVNTLAKIVTDATQNSETQVEMKRQISTAARANINNSVALNTWFGSTLGQTFGT